MVKPVLLFQPALFLRPANFILITGCLRTSPFFSHVFTCGFPLCLDISFLCVWESLVQIKTIQYDDKIHALSKQHRCFSVSVVLGFSPNTISYLENLQAYQ